MKTSTTLTLLLAALTFGACSISSLSQEQAQYMQDEQEMAENRDWGMLKSVDGDEIGIAYYQGDHPLKGQNSVLVDVEYEGKVRTLYPSEGQEGIYSDGEMTLVSLSHGAVARISYKGVTKVYR